MEIAPAFRISVTDRSGASEARRQAEGVAAKLGFREADIGSIAIIVTEAAKNISKYATKGEIIFQTLRSDRVWGVEMIALDQGPGMENPAACMRDGFSTGGSPGTGLGAINRLSTVFDIFSLPGLGTAVLSRYWPRTQMRQTLNEPWEIGAVCVPKPGQSISGDGFALKRLGAGLCALVTDGLGHGPLAATASIEAVRAFSDHNHSPGTVEALKEIHNALRSTRGAAVAVAHVDPSSGKVRFAGIGNISGVVMGPSATRSMVSHNGIVGGEIRKIQEFEYPWFDDAVLILHSDGISSRWNLDLYPGLVNRHPSIVAGVLHRDFGRGTDDSTIVVARQRDRFRAYQTVELDQNPGLRC